MKKKKELTGSRLMLMEYLHYIGALNNKCYAGSFNIEIPMTGQYAKSRFGIERVSQIQGPGLDLFFSQVLLSL